MTANMTEQSVISDLRASLANILPETDPLLQPIQSRSHSTSDSTCSNKLRIARSSLEDDFCSFTEKHAAEESSNSQSVVDTDPSNMDMRKETTDEHQASPSSIESSLCHDTLCHTQKPKSGLRERLRSLIKNALPKKEKCTGCDKEFTTGKLIIAPCEHRYCPHCLREMGHIALKNSDLFPVRCCSQEIPSRHVAAAMAGEGRETYTSRNEERTVPPTERWYCPQTKCGRWIRPRYLKLGSRSPRCPHCKTSICPNCRDIAHENRDCESDPALNEVLEVARRHRWQRCYNCHTMVEKTSGCNHMQCICMAEFCYQCSRRWPCHCRGTAEVVDDGAQLAADPDFDATTVVAAMEQAEQEVAEAIVTQQELVGQHERTFRLQEQSLWQVEQQERANRLQEQMIRHVEQIMFGRIAVGPR